MNPVLVIGVVFIVLLACGVVFDLRRRRLDAARRNLGLEARTARGRRRVPRRGRRVGRPGPLRRTWPLVPQAAGHARAAGPRLVICAAMMARWTSLVPSQMRSTRSSRKKRSATFSRM